MQANNARHGPPSQVIVHRVNNIIILAHPNTYIIKITIEMLQFSWETLFQSTINTFDQLQRHTASLSGRVTLIFL